MCVCVFEKDRKIEIERDLKKYKSDPLKRQIMSY